MRFNDKKHQNPLAGFWLLRVQSDYLTDLAVLAVFCVFISSSSKEDVIPIHMYVDCNGMKFNDLPWIVTDEELVFLQVIEMNRRKDKRS